MVVGINCHFGCLRSKWNCLGWIRLFEFNPVKCMMGLWAVCMVKINKQGVRELWFELVPILIRADDSLVKGRKAQTLIARFGAFHGSGP